MVNLDYQGRFKGFKQECIKYLQKIFPSKDDYEAGQKYAELSENIEKRLRKSGHTPPADNIMSIILEELSKIKDKQL